MYLGELAKAHGKITIACHKLAAEILIQLFTKMKDPAINYAKDAVFGLKEDASLTHHPYSKLFQKVPPRQGHFFLSGCVQVSRNLTLACGNLYCRSWGSPEPYNQLNH